MIHNLIKVLHNSNFIIVHYQLPISSSSQPLTITILFFASMSLTILDTLHKRNHAVFVFL